MVPLIVQGVPNAVARISTLPYRAFIAMRVSSTSLSLDLVIAAWGKRLALAVAICARAYWLVVRPVCTLAPCCSFAPFLPCHLDRALFLGA